MINKNKQLFVKQLLDALSQSSDVLRRPFLLASGQEAEVIFLESTGDMQAQRMVLERLTTMPMEKNVTQEQLVESIIVTYGATILNDLEECVERVLKGDTVLVIDGQKQALAIATAQWMIRGIQEPPTSSVLRGPREGFVEDLKVNITQLRRRLMTPDIVFERVKIGKYSGSDVAIAYISSIADSNIVEKVRERLKNINIDGLVDSNYLQQYLEEHQDSIFKQLGVYEKPDIVAAKLLEGRIAIMLNGSPIVLTLPFLLFEDLQQSEDYYIRRSRATFLRFLRLAAVFLGIFLPGIYVSIQVFHYTAIPLNFLYTLLNAIQGLPMRPTFEMIFALVLFEIIHEASVRMPKYVGMAMSIVGALVLGDTAVKAGLISSPAIMIVALSSIAIYTVPAQADTLKLLRIAFTLLGGVGGLFCMILGALGIIINLASLDSYGTPYLAPLAPLVKDDLKDAMFMQPILAMSERPKSIPNKNNTRQKS